MLEIERLHEAIARLADAASEFAIALGQAAVEMLSPVLNDNTFGKIMEHYAAYTAAANERPEWVHRATYSKKKRIRKKYHDRIMRQYGRAER